MRRYSKCDECYVDSGRTEIGLYRVSAILMIISGLMPPDAQRCPDIPVCVASPAQRIGETALRRAACHPGVSASARIDDGRSITEEIVHANTGH